MLPSCGLRERLSSFNCPHSTQPVELVASEMQRVQTALNLAVVLNYSTRRVACSSPKLHTSFLSSFYHFFSILAVSVVNISLDKYWRAYFTLDTGLGSVGTRPWPKRYDDVENSSFPGSPGSVDPSIGSIQLIHQSSWPISYARAMA